MWWSDYWWGGYWPMPWMFFGPVMVIVFVIICIAMMSFMMRGGMRPRSRRQDALDILKERFARGEIDQDEYQKRRRLLQA